MVTKIRVLALDIDGVLTDGTAALSDNGDEDKRLASRIWMRSRRPGNRG